ncbi:hypothetical protein OCU04_011286 [Sclerotinia nivalis]|uniref:Uncharacterized protein n=1 Tax=Sclerotinia nivalis TaxID=352851 RepID=A0A9X0ABZ1_9HELO|nr:hypothetical protein OCU04_011286 [Sclerotinia nivalis]
MRIPFPRKQHRQPRFQSQSHNLNPKSRKPTCNLSLRRKFRIKSLKRKFPTLRFRRGIFSGATRTRDKRRRVDTKRRFRRFLRPQKVHFEFRPRKFNCKWRFPGVRSNACFGFRWRGRRRVVHWESDTSTPTHTVVQAMNIHAQIASQTNTSSINGSPSTPFTPSEHSPHPHSQPEQPQTTQFKPDYHYPLSLAPENFPDTFYRLHRDENWREISELPQSPNNNSYKSSTSLQAIDTKPNNRIQKPIQNPPEHGWSAKNTYTSLPTSPKQILRMVRGHFSARGVSYSSIFVPGVWNERKISAVSLWDNVEDAMEEGKRFGGAQIFHVEGDLLRRASDGSHGGPTAGGSVVFCMDELLRRDSKLCMITRGRYGQASGEGNRGEGGGNGLRGKAYLVAGVIPGEFFVIFGVLGFMSGKKVESEVRSWGGVMLIDSLQKLSLR